MNAVSVGMLPVLQAGCHKYGLTQVTWTGNLTDVANRLLQIVAMLGCGYCHGGLLMKTQCLNEVDGDYLYTTTCKKEVFRAKDTAVHCCGASGINGC